LPLLLNPNCADVGRLCPRSLKHLSTYAAVGGKDSNRQAPRGGRHRRPPETGRQFDQRRVPSMSASHSVVEGRGITGESLQGGESDCAQKRGGEGGWVHGVSPMIAVAVRQQVPRHLFIPPSGAVPNDGRVPCLSLTNQPSGIGCTEPLS